MYGRLARGSAIALALLLAGALALLAHAVFSARPDLRATDARLALAGAATKSGAPKSLPFRVADAILGLGDDRAYREAVRLFHASRRRGVERALAFKGRGVAERELARLAEQGGDRARRSGAANLLGILTAEDAWLDPLNAQRHLTMSLEAFRSAVRLDPGHEEAKFNLELLLTLAASGKTPGGAERQTAGDVLAGSTPPGFGY